MTRYRITLNVARTEVLTLLSKLVTINRISDPEFDKLEEWLVDLSAWPEEEWVSILPLVEELRSKLYNLDMALCDVTNIINASQETGEDVWRGYEE